MRYFLFISFLIAFMFDANCHVELSWDFFHPIKKKWINIGVKGSVQEGLIANKDLPDPFYGMNESEFDWIENHEWEFRSIFFLDKQLDQEFVELIFPSIDTYAKVYLNEQLILETDNFFIPHSCDIKNLANKGLNELIVVFTPPIIYHKDKLKAVGYQLPAPNDVHEIQISPYSRKPQYQFGWDWALRINTIGINKPSIIMSYNSARLLKKTTRIISVSDSISVVEFDIYLSNNSIKEILWKSKLFGDEIIKCKSGFFTRRVEIYDPKLWWPRGHGEAYLYQDEVIIQSIDKQYLEGFNIKFGINTSELVRERDEWGESYYFKINGRRIFCKGANYIPQDIFPSRVKDQDIVEMVDLMLESNFNMIRVWGGGYYPDDIFFERCDELGIMVWQDLMFACSMYPGDSLFISNITKEFEYQIPRISSHPCVVVFNGNNEVKVAWENWGFQIKHGLYGKSAKEIQSTYNLIFRRLAPEIIIKHNNVPYIHTSPLSNWGKDDFYNIGSQHYWGVWHGKDPIEYFGKKIGRFNAEYGFQSFPEYNTLSLFSKKNDWNLKSEVMKHHQKSYVGNDMILNHSKRLFGKPHDFEEFVYLSQLTQSKAVSMAVASHRIDFPRCGGTLYWQLNDCWPAPTWSSIDYNGNWKALHYKIRDYYDDITILPKNNTLSNVDYYLVSDVVDTFDSKVNIKFFSLEGNLISQFDTLIYVNGNGSYKINLDKKNNQILDENSVVYFSFENHKGKQLIRCYDNLVCSFEKARVEDVKLKIDSINYDEKIMYLNICNKNYVRSLWVSSMVTGLKFDKNFVSLLPGNHTIKVEYKDLPSVKDFKLMWL